MAHPWIREGETGPLDDAAIVRPEPGGLVMTIDVITPIVDDPRAFGRIAAANALSDVYAMGGEPKTALTFVGFPTDVLPLDALREILGGVADACAEARCAIVGGHSVVDPEPKCGLAVTGWLAEGLEPWSHASARPGQVLVLTKALGTGILAQANKGRHASDDEIAASTKSMAQLNAVAMRVGRQLGATAATDVTGFGLLGHLKHIVQASGLRATLQLADVPFLPGVREHLRAGRVPGGTKRNLRYAEPVLKGHASEEDRLLLADAQTSGGLLMSLPAERADDAVRALRDQGCPHATVIGSLESADRPAIEIRA